MPGQGRFAQTRRQRHGGVAVSGGRLPWHRDAGSDGFRGKSVCQPAPGQMAGIERDDACIAVPREGGIERGGIEVGQERGRSSVAPCGAATCQVARAKGAAVATTASLVAR